MRTFADKVIGFYRTVDFTGSLPDGISIINPFKEDAAVMKIVTAFYKRFYDDNRKRHLVLGINPGRFGAGITGIPFTDTKRLQQQCQIPYSGKPSHEPSAVFVHDMMDAFGGIHQFCSLFYINSLFPLVITATGKTGREVNYNYYDSEPLKKATRNAIVENIRKQISFGIETDICFCFGTGKNEKCLRSLNDEHGFFTSIIALEHPRYIMQYKSKEKQQYIEKYLSAFNAVTI